jgi:hypothetical protein
MVANAHATATKPVRLLTLLREIKSGRWQRQQKAIRAKREKKLRETGGDLKATKEAIKKDKEALPGATFAGLFSYRADEHWTIPSGFLAADLDNLDSNLPVVREQLRKSPHLFFDCESVTGSGLRALFRIPFGTKPDKEKYHACFEAVRQHVRSLCGVEIDSCRDPARLSFVSADRGARFNLKATPIKLLPEQPRTKASTKASDDAPKRGKPDKETVREMLAVVPKRPNYPDWIKIVAAVGDALNDADAIEVLNEWSPEESPGEYADKLDHRLCEVHVGTLILRAREHGWTLPNVGPAESPPPPYVPPPLDLFPDEVQRFIRAGASTFDVDPAFFLLPVLSGAAAMVGNSRSLRLKEDYMEPAMIWTASVAPTGDGKTPGQQAATASVRIRERELIKANKDAEEIFAVEIAKWEVQKKKDRGKKPQKPPRLTCWMDDTTIEAVACALNDNPRGVLLVKDEFSHWFESMDQYHDRGGSDVSRWLSIWMGNLFALDRVTGSRSYRIPDPRCSITGNAVPDKFKQLLTPDFFARGLPARFLFAMPIRHRPRKWIDKDVPGEIKQNVNELFAQLAQLQQRKNDQGEGWPVLLGLSAEAKEIFVEFYNECAQRAFDADIREAAQWSKLSAYSARLALVGQLMWDPKATEVSGPVMRAACDLARWFGNEAERIYALIAETPEQRAQRKLIEFIERRGGRVTVREITQSFRALKNNRDEAERQLSALVRRGYGEWTEVKAARGPATREFQLHRVSTTTDFEESPSVEPKPVDVDNLTSQESADIANSDNSQREIDVSQPSSVSTSTGFTDSSYEKHLKPVDVSKTTSFPPVSTGLADSSYEKARNP